MEILKSVGDWFSDVFKFCKTSLSDYRNLFDAHVGTKLVKWSFTWMLASLPILFLALKQYLNTGAIDWVRLCATGEFFLVCIVMVAEPLGDIILAKKRSLVLLIAAIASIMFVASSTYLYSIVNTDEKLTVLADSTNNSIKSDTSSVSLQKEKTNEVKGDSAKLSKPSKGETKKTYTEKIGSRDDRLKSLSIFLVSMSFIIGFSSVYIVNKE